MRRLRRTDVQYVEFGIPPLIWIAREQAGIAWRNHTADVSICRSTIGRRALPTLDRATRPFAKCVSAGRANGVGAIYRIRYRRRKTSALSPPHSVSIADGASSLGLAQIRLLASGTLGRAAR